MTDHTKNMIVRMHKEINGLSSRIEVMQAYLDGKIIEWYYHSDPNNIYDSNNYPPIWVWAECVYSVKKDTMIQLGQKFKVNGNVCMFCQVDDDMVAFIHLASGNRYLDPVEMDCRQGKWSLNQIIEYYKTHSLSDITIVPFTE